MCIEYDVTPGIERHPNISNFHLEIEDDHLALSCWELKKDEDLMALLTPDELKMLRIHLIGLLQALHNEKVFSAALVPMSELPELIGGHGFFMSYKLASTSARLDD